MIKIDTDAGLDITLPDTAYDDYTYASAYACLISMMKPHIVTSVTASGIHLHRIRDLLVNIPGPRTVYPATEFVWTGDFAKIIVANIMNSLYNNTSFVIDTVEDYNEQRARSSTPD